MRDPVICEPCGPRSVASAGPCATCPAHELAAIATGGAESMSGASFYST